MPSAPPRACARCGRAAQRGQPCVCREPWEGSTHIGGKTDMRMRRSLDAYRAQHPYCEHPDCGRLMDQVDHIVPLAEMEPGDPRQYDHANFQSLCRTHHQQKTTEDALRGKRRLR